MHDSANSASKKMSQLDAMRRLRSMSEWEDVMRDPSLSKLCLRSYSAVKQTYLDVQELTGPSHPFHRVSLYCKNKIIAPYKKEELGEKFEAIEWFSHNLTHPRYIKQPQLVISGVPNTNKTNLITILKKVFQFMSRQR
jgi:hypothetical protein